MRFPYVLPFTVLLLVSCGQNPAPEEVPAGNSTASVLPSTAMHIVTPAFIRNGQIPAAYTCDGENLSPPFAFSGIPEGAQSLALIVDDPDAPSGDWVHWIVYNIDPSVTDVSKGTVPPGGTEGMGSDGNAAYGGPCPPSGSHRYFFRLYALDTALEFGERPDKASLLRAMEGHILAEDAIMGKYARAQQ